MSEPEMPVPEKPVARLKCVKCTAEFECEMPDFLTQTNTLFSQIIIEAKIATCPDCGTSYRAIPHPESNIMLMWNEYTGPAPKEEKPVVRRPQLWIPGRGPN